MVKFKFFVHCPGYVGGGYENTHLQILLKKQRR